MCGQKSFQVPRTWRRGRTSLTDLDDSSVGPPTSDDAPAKSSGLSIIGNVTQEGDDLWDEA